MNIGDRKKGIDVVEQAMMSGDANLYLEVSWAEPDDIIDAIRRVGYERVIWGLDAPIVGDNGENKDRDTYFTKISNIKNV